MCWHLGPGSLKVYAPLWLSMGGGGGGAAPQPPLLSPGGAAPSPPRPPPPAICPICLTHQATPGVLCAPSLWQPASVSLTLFFRLCLPGPSDWQHVWAAKLVIWDEAGSQHHAVPSKYMVLLSFSTQLPSSINVTSAPESLAVAVTAWT